MPDVARIVVRAPRGRGRDQLRKYRIELGGVLDHRGEPGSRPDGRAA